MNTMQSPHFSVVSGSAGYRSPSLAPLLSPRLQPTSASASASASSADPQRPSQQDQYPPRLRHQDYSLLNNGGDSARYGNAGYSAATPSQVFGETLDAQASPRPHSHSFPGSGQVSTFRSPSLRATLPSSSAFATPKSSPSLGHVLIAFLDSTAWGLVYAAVDAALSFVLVALYLVSSSHVGLPGNSSHSPKDPDSLPYLPIYLIVFEFIFAFLLILTFLPRLLLFYPTHSIVSRFMRPEVVLTLFSCLPVLILRGPWAWATPAYVYDGLTSSSWALVDHLIFAWPIRFLRLWWSLHRGLSLLASSPYVRFSLAASKVLDLIAGIVCCMMACSSTLHIIEVKYSPALKPGNSLSFFDAFFFTFLIAVTIAYDAGVVPDAVFPRLLVIFTILLGIALVPYGIAQVIHVVNLQSKYDASFQHDPHQNHVLVVGSGASLETFTLRHFLSQFFSPGNASSITTKVVVLVPHDPPERTAQVLREPAFRHRVQWIRGSVFSMDDLVRRAQARDAQACFVLARKYATSSHAVDADNVLRSMAIASATNAPIYVQCLLPENRGHFSHFSELVLCVDALKLAVLARSALCPGFSTFLYLISNNAIPGQFPAPSESSRDGDPFDCEFDRSAIMSVHVVQPHPSFAGRTMADAAAHLYRDLGVAVVASSQDDSGARPRLISPNARLHGEELLYVIAMSEACASRVASYVLPHHRFPTKLPPPAAQPVVSSSPDPYDAMSPNSKLRQVDFPSFQHFPYKRTSTVAASSFRPLGASSGRSSSRLPALGLQRYHTVDVGARSVPAAPRRRYSVQGPSSVGAGGGISGPIMVASSPTQVNHITALPLSSVAEMSGRHASSPVLSASPAGTTTESESEYESPSSPPLPPSSPFHARMPTSSAARVFSDHILVCVSATRDASRAFPLNLGVFLESLIHGAGPHLSERIPVVILCDHVPPAEEWSCLENIYGAAYVSFVKGCPLIARDLKRAGAERAARVIVLADDTAVVQAGDEGAAATQSKSDKTEDSTAVMVLFLVKSLCPATTFVIVEFVHRQTMSFLTERDVDASGKESDLMLGDEVLPHRSLSFRAGNVFTVSMLDSLIAQAYHSPHLIHIVRLLLHVADPWVQSEPDVDDSDQDSPGPGRTLYQDAIPAHLVGQPLHTAFEWFICERDAVVVGLYRLRQGFRSVFVCPSPRTVLQAQDWVFLLG